MSDVRDIFDRIGPSKNKALLGSLATIAIAGLFFYLGSNSLHDRPREVFKSPYNGVSLEVYARKQAFAMPGQSGDAPGVVMLKDSSGKVLKKMEIEMVQNAKDPKWSNRKVEIWAVLDWEW